MELNQEEFQFDDSKLNNLIFKNKKKGNINLNEIELSSLIGNLQNNTLLIQDEEEDDFNFYDDHFVNSDDSDDIDFEEMEIEYP